MDFEIGQKIICVDARPALNPWHRKYPLKWGGIYVVRVISPHDPTMISIDSSGRLWEQDRFRPLDRKAQTNIEFAHQILKDATKAPQSVPVGQSTPTLED